MSLNYQLSNLTCKFVTFPRNDQALKLANSKADIENQQENIPT